jgi:tyrosine-specific transport protein
MRNNTLGGLMLIVGTSIGAGVLALPIVLAFAGTFNAVLMLVAIWFIMTLGAFLMLEANLYFHTNSNLVTMASRTLGLPGRFFAWIIYLFLLYTLLTAYMAGGGDILYGISKEVLKFVIPHWLAILVFVFIFSLIVINGIRSVDVVNRFFIIIKLLCFTLLLGIILPHTQAHITEGNTSILIVAMMPVVTSFGFAIIVPSLRAYLKSDVVKLRKIILFGSLIPLVAYILWVVIIQMVIPLEGPYGLKALHASPTPITMLALELKNNTHSSLVLSLANFFSSFALLTSFLGVSLCLTDFLFDGLATRETLPKRIMTYFLVYLPPMIIVIFMPGVFIRALSFAGIFAVLLLILLPALMVLKGRTLATEKVYHVSYLKNKLGLYGIISIAILMVAFDVSMKLHWF